MTLPIAFIHSFITKIYIAPLQGYYSEALQILARLKRRVLRLEQNVSVRILGSNRCDKGRPFHTEGPTTENARAWVVEVRAKGTESNPCSDDRSELRPFQGQFCHSSLFLLSLSQSQFLPTWNCTLVALLNRSAYQRYSLQMLELQFSTV